MVPVLPADTLTWTAHLQAFFPPRQAPSPHCPVFHWLQLSSRLAFALLGSSWALSYAFLFSDVNFCNLQSPVRWQKNWFLANMLMANNSNVSPWSNSAFEPKFSMFSRTEVTRHGDPWYRLLGIIFSEHGLHCCSVSQSCLTLCDPMDCSM